MEYTESYHKLIEAFSNNQSQFVINDKIVNKFNFHSNAHNILPGAVSKYHCKEHDLEFINESSYFNDIGSIVNTIHVTDSLVDDNTDFNFFILRPNNNENIKKITFLFHGFNEKNWDKYFSWGNAICDKTKSAVVFFPIAFHMQRAPLKWSDRKEMFNLSQKRKEKYPNIVDSTLINVASSIRLHYMPQRFIWSGLQTYYDVIQFIEECKDGKHALVSKDFSFDIFAYSIGGLVAEILKLSNYKGYFDSTKVGLFCSGPVFNRLSPVSKFILDSEASVALYSYLVEHLDNLVNKDALLGHFMNGNHFEGKVFRSMLRYDRMRDFREDLLNQFAKDFYAITLTGDKVIPSCEVVSTLRGSKRNIDIRIDELDFSFPYSHENPFPVNSGQQQDVDASFNLVFDKMCDFFISGE